jgi:hypothetical protein
MIGHRLRLLVRLVQTLFREAVEISVDSVRITKLIILYSTRFKKALATGRGILRKYFSKTRKPVAQKAAIRSQYYR